MQPIDPAARYPRVHPSEEKLPAGEQTTWIFRPLTRREQAHISNSAAAVRYDGDEAEVGMQTGTVNYLRVKLGLVNFEGFGDVKPELEASPVRGGEDVLSDETLDLIPENVFEWAAGQVTSLTVVSIEDGKKSSRRSAPRSTKGSRTPAPKVAKGAPSSE